MLNLAESEACAAVNRKAALGHAFTFILVLMTKELVCHYHRLVTNYKIYFYANTLPRKRIKIHILDHS